MQRSNARLCVRSGRAVRITVALITAGALTACVSWKPVTLVENPSRATRPHMMTLTMKSGQVLELERPVVRQDSLFGKNRNGGAAVAVAVADVASARARDVNGGMTFLAVTGILLAALVLIFFATFSVGF